LDFLSFYLNLRRIYQLGDRMSRLIESKNAAIFAWRFLSLFCHDTRPGLFAARPKRAVNIFKRDMDKLRLTVVIYQQQGPEAGHAGPGGTGEGRLIRFLPIDVFAAS
jgi:hypothetical protein